MRLIDADSLIALVMDATILTDGFKDVFVKLVNGEPTAHPEPCEDAVSRSWLLTEYDRRHEGPPGGARKLIEEAPSVTPKQRTGKWISADAIFGGVPFYCSECGENTRDTVMGKPRWNFCPNCGADMREVTT